MAAKNNNKNICKLCFISESSKIDYYNDNAILDKIRKYLLITIESSSAICLQCYNEIQHFHEFYERIQAAQKNFIENSFVSYEEKVFDSSKSCSTQTEPMIFDEDTKNTPTTPSPSKEVTSDEDTFSKDVKNEEVFDDLKVFPKAKTKKHKAEGKCGVTDESSDSKDVCDTRTLKVSAEVKKAKKVSKSRQIPSDIEKKMVEFYNIKCEKCEDVKFTSFKMLNKHYLSIHNSQGYIRCCKRNIRVNDKSYLRNHMLKHLQPDICRCGICGKELSSLVTLKHHMILHKPTEERPFHCSECDKRFCCKNDLKNHEKAIHLPENEREDFICDVCGKVFQKVANLRYHHSTVHLQERKYICEICAKCFTTQSGLRTHMNAAHSTKGPIQCQECSKWLKNEDTFQKHLQLHQNNSYPCTRCDKICNSSTSLRSHMVKHSEERPFACNVCRKTFKTKTHLKNHSVQHSGGSNYKCPYCSKTFVNMSNYYTHRKRMHATERDHQKNDSAKVITRSDNAYQIQQQLNVEEQGNIFIHDYKIIKSNIENTNLTVMQEVPIVRQNIIVPPINIKYL